MVLKIRKTLILVSLVSMAAAAAMLVAAIFGLPIFDNGVILAILLTFAVAAVAGFFAISSLDIFDKNRVMSIVSLSLLGLSSVLALVIFWWLAFDTSEGSGFGNVFARITGVVSVFSVFAVIMITTNAKLQGTKHLLQIVTFAATGIVDLVIILAIVGVSIFSLFDGFVTFFVICCIVAVALLLACNIMAKSVDKEKELGTVRIPKAEYEALLKELEELRSKVNGQ